MTATRAGSRPHVAAFDPPPWAENRPFHPKSALTRRHHLATLLAPFPPPRVSVLKPWRNARRRASRCASPTRHTYLRRTALRPCALCRKRVLPAAVSDTTRDLLVCRPGMASGTRKISVPAHRAARRLYRGLITLYTLDIIPATSTNSFSDHGPARCKRSLLYVWVFSSVKPAELIVCRHAVPIKKVQSVDVPGRVGSCKDSVAAIRYKSRTRKARLFLNGGNAVGRMGGGNKGGGGEGTVCG